MIPTSSIRDAVMKLRKDSAEQIAWLKALDQKPMNRDDVRWVELTWSEVLTHYKQNTHVYV